MNNLRRTHLHSIRLSLSLAHKFNLKQKKDVCRESAICSNRMTVLLRRCSTKQIQKFSNNTSGSLPVVLNLFLWRTPKYPNELLTNTKETINGIILDCCDLQRPPRQPSTSQYSHYRLLKSTLMEDVMKPSAGLSMMKLAMLGRVGYPGQFGLYLLS